MFTMHINGVAVTFRSLGSVCVVSIGVPGAEWFLTAPSESAALVAVLGELSHIRKLAA